MNTLDLCNAALADIGHDRQVTDLSAATAEARRCALHFPRARREVLACHPWSFLEQPATPYAITLPDALVRQSHPYAYARPPDAFHLRLEDGSGAPVAFVSDAQTIHAAAEASLLVATYDDPLPELWPPAVQEAVTAALAVRLARVFTANAKTVQGLAQEYASKLRAAKALDAAANARHPGTPNRYASARL